MIASLIIKRFETDKKPYTANDISEKYKIPTQLTIDTLFLLLQTKIIRETPTEEYMINAYIPAIDINKISISYFFNRLDEFGSEDFRINKNQEDIKNIWKKTLEIREMIYKKEGDIL